MHQNLRYRAGGTSLVFIMTSCVCGWLPMSLIFCCEDGGNVSPKCW